MLDVVKNNSLMHALPSNLLERVIRFLPEHERASMTAGRNSTQFVVKTMNVFLLGRTPYSIMRQCLAKIERSKGALDEAAFRQRKNELLAQKHDRDASLAGDPVDAALFRLMAQKKRWDIEKSTLYIAGAIKNIANYQSIYEQVKVAAGIPDDWDELDYERAEAEHHIKQAFLQSLRDVVGPGAVNPGNQEYLENCGIGGIAGIFEIKTFLHSKHGGSGPPMMADIEAWLERMFQKYKDTPGDHLRSHGIEPIDEWYVFKDRNREIASDGDI